MSSFIGKGNITVVTKTLKFHIAFERGIWGERFELLFCVERASEAMRSYSSNRYDLLGCYHGEVESGKYPHKDIFVIKKGCHHNFVRGGKLVLAKRVDEQEILVFETIKEIKDIELAA
ncbi:MAG: hypothetical protein O2779_01780 [Nanoarchaeota archaeon]|nr:hypothetical protein [Nanoarchaeota archaeon]